MQSLREGAAQQAQAQPGPGGKKDTKKDTKPAAAAPKKDAKKGV